MQLLCPTDFSKLATEAANVAAALAAKRGLPLRLAYCTADWVMSAEVPVVNPRDQAAPEKLDAEVARLASPGLEVSSTLLMGTVHREIAAASQQSTEMIVMGSTGKGAAERWLIGSTAERVAESAPVPTLVVRQPEPLLAWLREGRSIRILCGVDFTASADAAIAAVKQLMTLGPVELEAVYIPRAEETAPESSTKAGGADPEPKITLERDVWERLRDLLGAETSVKVHVSSASGSPAFEFVRLADERKADLVVVGTHQRHGLQRLSAPSFSRGVLHHAAANVLCVPVSSYVPPLRMPVVRRVLVPTDLSPAGNEAIRHACSLLHGGGSLQILHVCPSPTSGLDPFVAARVYFDRSMETSKATADAETRMQALIPRQLATAGITISLMAGEHDDVATAICEAAERYGADVICMASRGHSPVVSAVLGSVVQKVIAHCHRPVFVVAPSAD